MKYYCDGFQFRGNPSPFGGGYTIVDENNEIVTREVIKQSGFTNNEAEIMGIKATLDLANNGDTVSTDSMCCLTWVNGGKSKARPDLNSTLRECLELRNKKNINLMWESRGFNLAGLYNENYPEHWEDQELVDDLSWIT